MPGVDLLSSSGSMTSGIVGSDPGNDASSGFLTVLGGLSLSISWVKFRCFNLDRITLVHVHAVVLNLFFVIPIIYYRYY